MDQFSIVFNEYKFGGMLNIMDNWKTSGLGVAENQNMKGIIRRQIRDRPLPKQGTPLISLAD